MSRVQRGFFLHITTKVTQRVVRIVSMTRARTAPTSKGTLLSWGLSCGGDGVMVWSEPVKNILLANLLQSQSLKRKKRFKVNAWLLHDSKGFYYELSFLNLIYLRQITQFKTCLVNRTN